MDAPVPPAMPPWAWIVALIITVVIGPTILAWMNHRQGKRIEHQVRDDHDTNLRDELDERHAELRRALAETQATLAEMTDCMARMHHGMGRLHARTKRIGEEVRDDRKTLDSLRSSHWAEKRRVTDITVRNDLTESD